MSATTELPDGWAPGRAAGSVARRSRPGWVRWVGWLLRRPSLVLAVALVVGVGVVEGPAVAAVGVVAVVVGLSVWARLHPASFDPTAGRVLRGAWRSAWTYGLRWRASMVFAGLGGRLDGDEWLPRVVRVRAGRYADRVRVRMVVGQQPADWERRSDSLAHAFGARSCLVTLVPGRPGYVDLKLGRRDRLVEVVDPLPIPAQLDLDAVPVGVTEDGEPWCLAVSGGAHTLIAGCTGSGKGSVLWSLLRGLAPGIREGLVDVRGVDPKGGMELTPGEGLFSQLAWRPEDMVELLEEAAWTMAQRATRLRGVVRVHTPDRRGAGDRGRGRRAGPAHQLRARPEAPQAGHPGALAAAVPGPGAGGDGRSPPCRTPARTWSSSGTCSRCGSPCGWSSRTRPTSCSAGAPGPEGAACELIPRALPGVGYQLLDGEQHPTRVRASWMSDAAIDALARDFPAAHRPHDPAPDRPDLDGP